MVRAYTKREIIDVLENLLVLHRKGLLNSHKETVFKVLEDCQEAAIAVGETIEHEFECPEDCVSILEEYCEALYQLYLQVPFQQQEIAKLDTYIQKTVSIVNKEPEKILVVFFPYKASMWDSLESIWTAAETDRRCECKVVPIPYFKIDREKQEAQFVYEGEEFPKYVPIIHYTDFSLEGEHPDIAYIHNPYDNYNYVTSIHPDYYSGVLRQHVGKLIYVPYYVTSGNVSEHHKDLPVYENMDYMIVQSEQFRSGFASTKYYNKILPLGSPKFDRVIAMERKGTEIFDEWDNIVQGKPTVMLNTSINCFLSNGEKFIRKLWDIFRIFEEDKEVVLIWRPHPLIEATIKAMRWELSDAYQKLKNYFLSHQIGILDQTPDITKTVIYADAYIGESSSSVVSLFDIAGKPIYILDNYIYKDASIDEQKTVRFFDTIYESEKWWITSVDYNGLFCVDNNNWEEIHFIGRIEGQNKWSNVYAMLENYNDNILLCPFDASESVFYDKMKQKFVSTPVKDAESISAMKMFRYKTSIFYVSSYKNLILEWQIETGKCIRYEGIYSELYGRYHRKHSTYIWGAVSDGKYIFITSIDSNKLLKFNMETKRGTIHKLGNKQERFSGISCDSEYIYVAETQTGNIKCFDKQLAYVYTIRMPEEFKIISNMDIVIVAHNKIVDMKEWIITIPFIGNSMVKINKRSKETKVLMPEFWTEESIMPNGSMSWKRNLATFAKVQNGKTLLVQRLADGALAELNVESETYKICYPKMSEESFQKFMEGQDGFEKLGKDNNFACRENSLFPIKKFLIFLVKEDYSKIRERQMQSLCYMNANMDGSCGKKVHEFMMEQVYGVNET